MSARLGIVFVSYGNENDILESIRSVLPQLKQDDKLIVVDNKKPYVLSKFLAKNNVNVEVVNHDNGGFAAGCNYGANKLVKDVDVLLFLNPDTYVKQEDYLTRMRAGYGIYAAWQSLLLLPNGNINNYGNTVHITGLTWSSRFNETAPIQPRHVLMNNLSGACLAIDVKWWKKIGGFTEEYFMYFEDADISTKILIAGGQLGMLEEARLHHHYDFEKGTHKWQYIERSRLIYMTLNWPTRLLILTFIPNLFVNFAIFLQYVSKRRGFLKVKSDLSFLRNLHHYFQMRKARRSLWQISSKKYFSSLAFSMDTDLLGKITDNKVVYTLMKAYHGVLKLFFI